MCALAATTGSPIAVLAGFTVAAFFATCAWVSAYPTIAELFPTHLRATGFGVAVGVGRTGAIVGQIILALFASSFSLVSIFLLLGAFWLIGTFGGLIFWGRGRRGCHRCESGAIGRAGPTGRGRSSYRRRLKESQNSITFFYS